MPTVETARGPVDVDDLGVTLMHEHVVNVNAEVNRDQPEMSIDGQREAALERVVRELQRVAAAGVRTFVDCSCYGHGRDMSFIEDVSKQVDLNIVVASGMYTFNDIPKMFHYRPPTVDSPRDALTELFVRDVRHGVAGTGIKAGIFKCATDKQGVTEGVERVLRAVAVAHRETGVPITTHTSIAERNGLDQQRIFAEEGVDLTRVIIGHCGDAHDFDYLRQLMDAGSYIGCDRFGLYLPGRLDLEGRVELVAHLCELGYAGQIVLSSDKTLWTDWWGTGHGLHIDEWHHTHIVDDVLPAMRKRGVTDEQIDQMMIENPRKIFSVQGSY